jgi:hypothetical protein
MMRVLVVAMVMVPMLVLGTLAGADEFKLTPSVAVRQEYNSNIFFDSSKEKDSFITRVMPGLELIERTERIDLRLAGFVTPYVYWEDENLNSVDQDYSGRIDYKVTPLLSVGANAAVRVDHQPDRDIYTTGLAYGDNRRVQQNYGGNVGYMFTEKTSGSVTYGYTREDWRKGTSNSDLEDYDSHAVTLGLSRELGAAKGVTIGLLNVGWARYNYETSDTDYFFGTVGVKQRLTEIFNITADVGARYTDSSFDVQQLAIVPPGVLVVATDQQNDSGWGGIGHLAVEYVGEKTRASVGGSHDINPASGSDGVVQRTGFTFDGGHLLTEKLRLGLFAGAFRNKSGEKEFSGQKTEEYTYSINPSLRWEFYRDFTLEAGYSFTYLDNQADNESALRHLGYIQLAYGLPLFE